MVKSEFYRNIAGLFTGIFAARLIPALFALVIARLYAPSEFGIFLLFLSFASLLSILSTASYERAILLAGDLQQKQHIFRFSMKINLIVNGLVMAGLVIFLVSSHHTSLQDSAMYLLIPVFSLFFGGLQLIRNILISNKLFKKLSILELIRALITGILQTLFFIIPDTGLFLGITIAQIITFSVYFFRLPETSGFQSLRFNPDETGLARRYINFPKYSVPSELLNYLSSQLPVFMIKPFFGGTLLGLYSFSHRYLSIPVQLTSISIGSVYVQKAQSLKKSPDALGDLTFDLFKKQFLTAIIPFTILALWGREIFGLVFGPDWEFSGTLGQMVAPWLFAVFIGSPLANILIIMEKQNISLIFNVLMLIFRAAALITGGIILRDITLTIALYSLTGFLFFTALTVFSLQMAHVNLFKALRFSAVTFILVVIPLLILKLWI
jgi:O-antigen/teichoic acid export membrane protein